MISARTKGPMMTAIPPELLRSAPRSVVLSRQGKATVVIAIVLALAGIIGGAMLYRVTVRAEARAQGWTSDSVTTQAQVVQVGRTRDKERRRVLTYRYSAGDRELQGRTVLRQRDRREFPQGSTVDIRYARDNPGVSWIPGYEPRGAPLWIVPVLSLSMLVPALLIALSVRGQRRILAEGRPALARVIQVKKRSTHNAQSYYRVEYEFEILSGATRRGRADSRSLPPAAGSTMVILYDRERPAKSVLYPLPLVRVAVPA